MISRILRKFKFIYETNFILVIAVSSTAYMHSSYLKGLGVGIPEGILFAFGSLAAFLVTIDAPPLFEKYGVSKVVQAAGFANIFMFLLMGLNIHPILSVCAFVVAIASTAILVVSIDVLIEHFTKRGETGEIRGINLALRNFAFLLGPLLAGLIADEFSLNSVYIFASLTMFLLTFFFHNRFKKLKLFPKHTHKNARQDLQALWKEKDLRNSYISGFMTELFFAIWAVFITIYMHEVVGFSWEYIGVLFAIMHIPYLIVQPIIGDLIDKHKKEYIFMSVGLALMAGSLVWLVSIQSLDFLPWIGALLLSRIGASFGQVAHESFFFERVKHDDTDLVSAYRSMTPLSLLLGPFIGSIVLLFTGYRELFILTAIILILTILVSQKLTHEKRR